LAKLDYLGKIGLNLANVDQIKIFKQNLKQLYYLGKTWLIQDIWAKLG